MPFPTSNLREAFSPYQSPLTGPETILRELAHGDIEINACHADRLAGVVEEHCTFPEQPVNATVRPHDAEFGGPGVRRRHALLQGCLHPLAVVRMNQAEPLLMLGRRIIS